MSLWTSCILGVLLLVGFRLPARAQELRNDLKIVVMDEPAAVVDELPRQLEFSDKDFELAQAYADVFRILSDRNTCSSFYGGPLNATTVLNDFVPLVRSHRLVQKLSFKMTGRPRIFHNTRTGFSYRLFDSAIANSDGPFYRRRLDSTRMFSAAVGRFPPGTRRARALILLHELGHLIENENGAWLIPDDGYDDATSSRNTLVVQRACRRQLETLK